MLSLLAIAAEATEPIPERYHGSYVPEATLVGLLGLGEPHHARVHQLEVTASGLVIDRFVDTEEVSVTYALEGSVAWVTHGQARYARLEDAAPALAFLSDLDRLHTAQVLSRGWVDAEGRAWRMEYAIGAEPLELVLTSAGTVKPARGGFGFNDSFVVDDVEWGLDLDGDTLALWEAAPQESPDLEPLDGGRRQTLRAMATPPYVILASRLNLRAEPSTSAAKVGGVQGGDWVRVIARTGPEAVGGLTAPWLLVHGERGVGWAFGAYVGLREEPVADATGALRVSPVGSGAALRWGEGRCESLTREGEPLALQSDRDDDGDLDTICVFHRGEHVEVCPLPDLGCMSAPASAGEIPPVFFRDADGDGDADLHVGDAEPVIGLLGPSGYVGSWAPPLPVAAAAAEAERPVVADGLPCACATPAVAGGPVALLCGAIFPLVRRRRRRGIDGGHRS